MTFATMIRSFGPLLVDPTHHHAVKTSWPIRWFYRPPNSEEWEIDQHVAPEQWRKPWIELSTRWTTFG
jgi:hypothetical protein